MPRSVRRTTGLRSPLAWLPVVAVIFSPAGPLTPAPTAAVAVPPRADRVANRIAERRYARMSIADARAARAEALVAEIAPLVPEPPLPRPVTVRRMLRAGVPLGVPPVVVAVPPWAPLPPWFPMPPAVVTRSVPDPATSAASRVPPAPPVTAPATASAAAPAPRPAEAGAFTLDPDPAAAPAAAEVAPDGTRSVLATGGDKPAKPAVPPTPDSPAGPAVTQPPVELLPTPEAR